MTATGGVTLTDAQFQALLGALSNQSTAATATTPNKPRVGGSSPVGLWTGEGAQGLGMQPTSGNCMRYFKGNELKAFQALQSVEKECKAGLQGKGALVFGLQGEPNFDKGALLLRELDEYLTYNGLESVFHIVNSDGTTVDMLKQPGFVNTELVESWVKDLADSGVHDGKGGRLTVCEFDVMNLQYSYHAILNSCTASLRQDLINNLAPGKHTGPQALMLLLTKVYPTSYTKVKGLIQALEKLNIKDVPGENITTLVQKASDLIREIQMNFLQKNQVPDLCVSALRPFTTSSHEYVRHYVTDKMFLANKLIMAPSSATSSASTNVSTGSGSPMTLDPLVLLQGLEELYLTLKQQSNYPPGEQIAADKKFKAMQGEVKKLKEELDKLTQDRSASSTTSKKGKKKDSSTGPLKTKKGELVVCHHCKGNHWNRDCPNNDANSNSNGSNGTGSGSGDSGTQNGGDSKRKKKKTPIGLSKEVDEKTIAAAKQKMESMPPREQIPDDAKYTITIDGTVTAKYCRHCGNFCRGARAHFTPDCRNRTKFAYQPAVAGNLASVTPNPAPPHESSGPPNSHLIQCSPRMSYDFSDMTCSSQPSSNLAVVDEADDEEAEHDWMPNAWINLLSKDYGEQ